MTHYTFDFATSGTGITPAGLSGVNYWYDTKTVVNGEAVYYETSDTYAYWNDGTQWVITAVADVDGAYTDYFKSNIYPTTMQVSGTGEGAIDVPLYFKELDGSGYPIYSITADPLNQGGDNDFLFFGGKWNYFTQGNTNYENPSTEKVPPKTGWVISNGVVTPLPTIAYELPTALIAYGTWEGTLEIMSNTIADAWYRAETTAFDSLTAFVGSTENDTCFRGYLPIMGDGTDYKYVNVWMMTSGGSGTFDIDRLQGESGNWCSLRSDARIESLWKTRQEAMEFSGACLAWLVSTGNLAQPSGTNVTWATLAGIPEEPEPYLTQGHNRQWYWKQNIEFDLVYRTADIYA